MYHILKPRRQANTAAKKGKMNLSYITTVDSLKEARELIKDTRNIIYALHTSTTIKEK